MSNGTLDISYKKHTGFCCPLQFLIYTRVKALLSLHWTHSGNGNPFMAKWNQFWLYTKQLFAETTCKFIWRTKNIYVGLPEPLDSVASCAAAAGLLAASIWSCWRVTMFMAWGGSCPAAEAAEAKDGCVEPAAVRAWPWRVDTVVGCAAAVDWPEGTLTVDSWSTVAAAVTAVGAAVMEAAATARAAGEAAVGNPPRAWTCANPCNINAYLLFG